MADRRTRDQLRASNAKLRKAIRHFVTVQDHWLAVAYEFSDGQTTTHLPADWKQAYDALKELMGLEKEETKQR